MPPERPLILVVEDDRTLARGLEINLRAEGFEVVLARDGETGLELAVDGRPDLILLDLMLPGIDGPTLLAEFRHRGRETPVIVVSARSEVDDKVALLRLGADDYVTKPFVVRELAARIWAALRRPQRRPERRLVTFGAFTIDLDGRALTRDGQPVAITAQEFALLAYLVSHPGRVHSRERLLDAAWGYEYDGTARTVDNFVRRLRVKLEEAPKRPRHLVTVRGGGYRFDP